MPESQCPPPSIAFCIAEYEDLRGEIKQRIEQRDKYSTQMLIAIAGILSFGLIGMSDARGYAVLIAPPVALAYTALIQYSYRIHAVLTTYLRNQVAAKTRSLCSDPGATNDDPAEWEVSRWDQVPVHGLNWETYCAVQKIIGVRQAVFLPIMWGVLLVSLISAIYFHVVAAPQALSSQEFWQYNPSIFFAIFTTYSILGLLVHRINK